MPKFLLLLLLVGLPLSAQGSSESREDLDALCRKSADLHDQAPRLEFKACNQALNLIATNAGKKPISLVSRLALLQLHDLVVAGSLRRRHPYSIRDAEYYFSLLVPQLSQGYPVKITKYALRCVNNCAPMVVFARSRLDQAEIEPSPDHYLVCHKERMAGHESDFEAFSTYLIDNNRCEGLHPVRQEGEFDGSRNKIDQAFNTFVNVSPTLFFLEGIMFGYSLEDIKIGLVDHFNAMLDSKFESEDFKSAHDRPEITTEDWQSYFQLIIEERLPKKAKVLGIKSIEDGDYEFLKWHAPEPR